MLTEHFLIAVTVIYLGFIAIGVDLFFEPDLREKGLWRLGGVAIVGLLAVGFSWAFVFTKAPLGVSAFMVNADYPEGTVIAGISWNPKFTELEVWFSNDSDQGYDDLSMLIRPTTAIAGIGQLTNLPGVSWDDKSSLTSRLMSVSLGTGKVTAVPLSLLATDAGYTVRCAHLQSKTPLKIVLALADIKWDPKPNPDGHVSTLEDLQKSDYILRFKDDDFGTYWEGHPNGDIWAPRPTSEEWIKIKGTYLAGHKSYSISQKLPVGGELSIKR